MISLIAIYASDAEPQRELSLLCTILRRLLSHSRLDLAIRLLNSMLNYVILLAHGIKIQLRAAQR